METIFSVQNEHLARLTPDQAVDIFRALLWAEATATGIGKNLINIPSAITVADGGIDAEVVGAVPLGGQGLIKQGMTRYQIKTGSFSLSGNSHIRDLLFQSGSNQLKSRIKSCLDAGGTLIAVLFGSDNPEPVDGQTIQKIVEELKLVDSSYVNSKIEVWRQNQIRGVLVSISFISTSCYGPRQDSIAIPQELVSSGRYAEGI